MTRQSFQLPPQQKTERGKIRRVGFELEFSGVTLDQATEIVQSVFEGALVSKNAAQAQVETASGTYTIELDWAFIKRQAAKAQQEEPDSVDDWWRHVSDAAALLVPMEVVCPPIEVTRMHELQPMLDALRQAGAQGTDESIVAAYGVHINAEIPALNAHTLVNWMQAFALLQWWLADQHALDMTRRMTPYINLYPEAYLKKLLSLQTPDMDTLFSDYLQYNADRNRALDLLPILAQIDAKRVQQAVNDDRVKARPAFHYRLPNCHIDQADWSLAQPWNLWCVVERLAARPEDIAVLAERFHAAERPVLGVNHAAWVRFMNQWLIDHELV